MKFKGGTRPGKFGSIQVVIMGICLVLSVLLALATQNLYVFIGGFIVTWAVLFFGNILFHVMNLFDDERPYSEEIDGTLETNQPSLDSRLKKLNELYRKGLIDASDYKQRKSEILKDI